MNFLKYNVYSTQGRVVISDNLLGIDFSCNILTANLFTLTAGTVRSTPARILWFALPMHPEFNGLIAQQISLNLDLDMPYLVASSTPEYSRMEVGSPNEAPTSDFGSITPAVAAVMYDQIEPASLLVIKSMNTWLRPSQEQLVREMSAREGHQSNLWGILVIKPSRMKDFVPYSETTGGTSSQSRF